MRSSPRRPVVHRPVSPRIAPQQPPSAPIAARIATGLLSGVIAAGATRMWLALNVTATLAWVERITTHITWLGWYDRLILSLLPTAFEVAIAVVPEARSKYLRFLWPLMAWDALAVWKVISPPFLAGAGATWQAQIGGYLQSVAFACVISFGFQGLMTLFGVEFAKSFAAWGALLGRTRTTRQQQQQQQQQRPATAPPTTRMPRWAHAVAGAGLAIVIVGTVVRIWGGTP